MKNTNPAAESGAFIRRTRGYSVVQNEALMNCWLTKRICKLNMTALQRSVRRCTGQRIFRAALSVPSKYRRSQPASESCGGRLPPVLTLRWTAGWCRIRCKGRRIGGKTRPVKEYIAAPIDFSFFLA